MAVCQLRVIAPGMPDKAAQDPPSPIPELTSLDPADWGATRALAHRMLDDMIDYTATGRERPLWPAMPAVGPWPRLRMCKLWT